MKVLKNSTKFSEIDACLKTLKINTLYSIQEIIMLRQIQEVAKFDSETALQFFTKSYIKYSHLGDSLEFVGPIKVSLKTIEKEDQD